MPTYDYRCDACGKTYDVFHKVREVIDDVECPSCGSHDHTRLLSAPNVSMSMSVKGGSSGADSCAADGGGCCGGSCGLN